MKKIIIALFLSLCTLPMIAEAAQLKPVNCHPQLQPYFVKMMALPEIRDLVAKVQEEGPINIMTYNNHLSTQFGAFYDLDQRTICVCMTPESTPGDVISSILFELHNAEATSKINYVDHLATSRAIDRNKYVESIEFIEYENSLKASAIAKKGIEQGIFPSDSHLHTYKDFQEHYYYQQKGGHSAAVAKNYDNLFS